VVLSLAWFAWSAQRVYSDLDDARGQARALSAALSEGDASRAEDVLARFQRASDAAADRTDSATWGLFERVAVYGDDARALGAVSQVLSSLGRDGVAPLIESAHQLDARAYAPHDARFPLKRIAALEGPAAGSHEAFANAADELSAYDSTNFVAPLAKAYDDLRSQVDAAESALDTALRASRLMPSFLGAAGERDYLFVFQNNAEVRSSGGLPGNISRVHVDAGRVQIARQEAAGPMGRLEEPVLSLTEDELATYGRQLGTYFHDANFTPDFPRSAELWRARWQREFGEEIDGVFTIDPVTLSYLLEATGPMTLQGMELTADNVVQVVENLVYVNISNQGLQDEFLNAVAKRAFDTFAAGVGDQVKMLQALYRGVTEGRVRLHSFVESEQREVAGTEIAGELPVEETGNPHVGVYFNDGTGSKMSYYLDYAVEVAPVACNADGGQDLLGRLEITSNAPPDAERLPDSVTGFDAFRARAIERGQQLVVGDLFGPVGGVIRTLTVDGKPSEPVVVDTYQGRPVASVALLFEPGETHLVTWDVTTGRDQGGPTAVAVTPGVAPEDESFTARSAC
jgi:hypothetical protein